MILASIGTIHYAILIITNMVEQGFRRKFFENNQLTALFERKTQACFNHHIGL